MKLATIAILLVVTCAVLTAHAATPDADAQVRDLEAMCDASSEARAARHAQTTLYLRLGGGKAIHQLTREIVRLHRENDAIKGMFAGLNDELVAARVADFMISGMGGSAVYDDRPTLPESHRHLNLTNADFMTAGADVIQAMKNLGHGQDEIDEVVCALVALRPMVVFADAR